MELSRLIRAMGAAEPKGAGDREIAGLAYDSRRVKPGTLFFALPGARADGHAFVNQAAEKGAAAIVVEREVEVPKAATIRVPCARRAMALASAAFFGHPGRALRLAAVTGTNGKTTFAFLLKHILDSALMRAGLIGTVRYEIGDRVLPASRTTPESLDLQEMLAQMVAAGCRAAVMEVSSHALDQGRAHGLEFDVAAFTNLTQDHLDYHGTMENYFAAKRLLFAGMDEQKDRRGTAVLNLDDRHGARLADEFSGRLSIATYGLGARGDYRASDVRIDWNGTAYRLDAGGKSYLVRLPLIGRFNVYNSLAAIAAAHRMGIEMRTVVKALADAPAVPGRLEPVPVKRPFKVFVDYAHTPDALANAIKALRDLGPGRLVVIFGCGGDRDRGKRPLMAAAVEAGADYAIVTSDNPRRENPDAILADIVKGFRAARHEVVPDRKEAIFRAVSLARPRDILLLAGKGHETYQEYADRTVPFDDVQIAREAMEARLPDGEEGRGR
jgi:UDP-N-acetylmuramoyl-L-alanyl-D-glutamate--2,6-diaminopimelate ligase